MSWSTLTTDDVLSELTPEEKTQLETVQASSTVLEAILSRTIGMARGLIAAGGYALGESGTTPEQIAPDVIAIARWRWLVSLPNNETLQSKPRKEAHDQAMERLEKIAAQEINVEAPTAAAASNWNSENKLVPRAHPVPRPAAQGASTANRYANPNGPADQAPD